MKTIKNFLYFHFIKGGKTILYYNYNRIQIIKTFRDYQKYKTLGYSQTPFNV